MTIKAIRGGSRRVSNFLLTEFAEAVANRGVTDSAVGMRDIVERRHAHGAPCAFVATLPALARLRGRSTSRQPSSACGMRSASYLCEWIVEWKSIVGSA